MRMTTARILSALGYPDAELSLLIVGERAMRSLNRRFRGIDRATDVLSFPQLDADGRRLQPQLLGDVVICADKARRQAKEHEHALAHEYAVLLTHGILHLLGQDHENDDGASRMARAERRLLALFDD